MPQGQHAVFTLTLAPKKAGNNATLAIRTYHSADQSIWDGDYEIKAAAINP